MPILTVTNQKGGVGKTTTTLNLAAGLVERGVRVLVVDFDPQGSLTTCCGLAQPARIARGRTIADALLTTVNYPVPKPVTAGELVIATPTGVDLVPANQELSTAEKILYAVYGREYALRDTLASLRADYDVILVDSVPTLGLLAINSLAAADGLIIPVQAEFLATHGLEQLLESVKEARQRLNPDLEIWGVVLTMVDHRTKHSRGVIAGVREGLAGQVRVFKTEIPEDVKLKESSEAGLSVLGYQPRSRGARAYRELAEEVALLMPAANGAAAAASSSLAEAPAVAPVVQTGAPPSANGSAPPSTNGSVPPRPAARRGRPDAAEAAAVPISPTRLDGVCPYLGLVTDPTHHSPEVRGEHRCYAAAPPLEISRPDQHLTCLTPQHSACVRFFRANLNGVVAPSQQPAPAPSVLGRLRGILKRSS